MDIADRILILIDELKLSKKAFAESINVSPSSISDWINPAKNSKPTSDVLHEIGERHKVNLNWLLTNAGPIFFGRKMPAPDPGDEIDITIIQGKLKDCGNEVTRLKRTISQLSKASQSLCDEREKYQELCNKYLIRITELQDEISRLKDEIIKMK